MAASRSIRGALPTYDSCGASGGNRRAWKPTLITSRVKTEMLQLRLMEKKRELVRMDEVNAMIDSMMGVVLTAMSSMPTLRAAR